MTWIAQLLCGAAMTVPARAAAQPVVGTKQHVRWRRACAPAVARQHAHHPREHSQGRSAPACWLVTTDGWRANGDDGLASIGA